MTAGTTPVTIQSSHALRVAELLDNLSRFSDYAEGHLSGERLYALQIERRSAEFWARELRDAVTRQKPVSIDLGAIARGGGA